VWKVIQFSVVIAVLFSNIRYEWTPNPYLASILAFLAALLVSGIPIAIAEIWADRKRR
jgi:hypothetical protein